MIEYWSARGNNIRLGAPTTYERKHLGICVPLSHIYIYNYILRVRISICHYWYLLSFAMMVLYGHANTLVPVRVHVFTII